MRVETTFVCISDILITLLTTPFVCACVCPIGGKHGLLQLLGLRDHLNNITWFRKGHFWKRKTCHETNWSFLHSEDDIYAYDFSQYNFEFCLISLYNF